MWFSPSTVLALALASGLLAVERKAFLQAMLSRPLVAGALLGWLVGSPSLGLTVGSLLELYYLGAVNFGAALPEHELVVTTAAFSCAASLTRSLGLFEVEACAAAVLVALPLGPLGRLVDQRSEQLNERLTEGALRPGRPAARVNRHLLGLLPPFAAGAGASLLGWLLVLPLGPLLGAYPLRMGLYRAGQLMFLVAAAVALRAVRHPRAAPLGMGAASAAALGWFLLQVWRQG